MVYWKGYAQYTKQWKYIEGTWRHRQIPLKLGIIWHWVPWIQGNSYERLRHFPMEVNSLLHPRIFNSFISSIKTTPLSSLLYHHFTVIINHMKIKFSRNQVIFVSSIIKTILPFSLSFSDFRMLCFLLPRFPIVTTFTHVFRHHGSD